MNNYTEAINNAATIEFNKVYAVYNSAMLIADSSEEKEAALEKFKIGFKGIIDARDSAFDALGDL